MRANLLRQLSSYKSPDLFTQFYAVDHNSKMKASLYSSFLDPEISNNDNKMLVISLFSGWCIENA